MQPSPTRAKRAKAEPAKNESPLKVVKGKKLERRRKTRIALSAAAVIIIAVTVLHLVLPVGIAENIGNLTALIGAGGYPVTLESSDTLNTVSRGGIITCFRIRAFAHIRAAARKYTLICTAMKTRAKTSKRGRLYSLRAETKRRFTICVQKKERLKAITKS